MINSSSNSFLENQHHIISTISFQCLHKLSGKSGEYNSTPIMHTQYMKIIQDMIFKYFEHTNHLPIGCMAGAVRIPAACISGSLDHQHQQSLCHQQPHPLPPSTCKSLCTNLYWKPLVQAASRRNTTHESKLRQCQAFYSVIEIITLSIM